MTVSILTLFESDLAAANAILQSAFQRAENWLPELRLFCRLQPDGIFLARVNGLPAGMVATILYSNYAFVGMMGVHREFQNQGLGRALMEHVLAWTREQKAPLVKLDASPFGQPLYEKLGFIALEEVYVLERQAGPLNGHRPGQVHLMTPRHLDLVAAPDKKAFGADRGRLLRALLETYPERAFVLNDEQGQAHGYLIAQGKRLGPWVVEGVDAEPLLLAALSLPFDGAISIVTPAENVEAIKLLKRYNFKVSRVNRHMCYGVQETLGQREMVFGQTSLSFG